RREEIFFSLTFGGETLSLAAASATLDKLRREPVTKTVLRRGDKPLGSLRQLIKALRLDDVLTASGHPTWSFLLISDTPRYTQWEIKTLLLQELFARGILSIGTHNLSYAHTDADIGRLLAVYDEVFAVIGDALADKAPLHHYLRCDPLVPLCKVR